MLLRLYIFTFCRIRTGYIKSTILNRRTKYPQPCGIIFLIVRNSHKDLSIFSEAISFITMVMIHRLFTNLRIFDFCIQSRFYILFVFHCVLGNYLSITILFRERVIPARVAHFFYKWIDWITTICLGLQDIHKSSIYNYYMANMVVIV